MSESRKPALLLLVTAILGVVVCFGYMTGSDWREYELLYMDAEIGLEDPHTEIGYRLLMSPFILLGFSFWQFQIIVKIILFTITVYFIWIYSKETYLLALAVHYAFLGIFSFIDYPARFMIASTIFLFGFHALLQGRIFAFYVITLAVSVLFHYGFVLVILFHTLLRRSYRTSLILSLYILMNVGLGIFGNDIIDLSRQMTNEIAGVSQKMEEATNRYVEYDNVTNRWFSLGLLAKYVLFVLLLAYRKDVEQRSPGGDILFNAAVFSFFILRFAMVYPIAFRYAIPLSVAYAAVFGTIARIPLERNRALPLITIASLSAAGLYFQVTADYRYIPYSSYLMYVGQHKPDFYYRSDFNFSHSPYHRIEVDER